MRIPGYRSLSVKFAPVHFFSFFAVGKIFAHSSYGKSVSIFQRYINTAFGEILLELFIGVIDCESDIRFKYQSNIFAFLRRELHQKKPHPVRQVRSVRQVRFLHPVRLLRSASAPHVPVSSGYNAFDISVGESETGEFFAEKSADFCNKFFPPGWFDIQIGTIPGSKKTLHLKSLNKKYCIIITPNLQKTSCNGIFYREFFQKHKFLIEKYESSTQTYQNT